MWERTALASQKGYFMFYRKNLPGWERARPARAARSTSVPHIGKARGQGFAK
jgi:hypothetical protein